MAGKKGLNETVAAIKPSATLAITSRAKQMIKEGKTVFSFGAGEPDFDTPEHIKAAAVKALADRQTKYAPTPGFPELRRAIAEKLRRDNGLDYGPDQVLVSDGGKHSLFNIFMTICQPGDEVIIPAPFWLSYPEMVRVGGGVPVFVECLEENGLRMTPGQFKVAITDRTKAVVINTPSNPIGNAYDAAALRPIAELAVERGLLLVSDEMYEQIIYDGFTHTSVGSLSPEILAQTITANGFSKTYSMTGWRLGYFAGPLEIVKAASALQSHSTSGANTFAQYGAIEALSGSQDCVKEMVTAFTERRDRLYERLTAIDGVTCVKPQGAFYVFPNISSFGLDSVTFAQRLLDEEGVAVVPGAPFGADAHVRLAYACSMDNIEKGMDGFEAFVAKL